MPRRARASSASPTACAGALSACAALSASSVAIGLATNTLTTSESKPSIGLTSARGEPSAGGVVDARFSEIGISLGRWIGFTRCSARDNLGCVAEAGRKLLAAIDDFGRDVVEALVPHAGDRPRHAEAADHLARAVAQRDRQAAHAFFVLFIVERKALRADALEFVAEFLRIDDRV